MKLSLYPYQLRFKYPFRIAHGMRTHTDIVYVKLEYEGCCAWGEASLPPYLAETQQTVINFLEAFDRSLLGMKIEDWFAKLNETEENMPAKAALDMALWSLKGQLENKPVRELLGISDVKANTMNSFYTIGLGTREEMEVKIADGLANGFFLFKIKLNGDTGDYKIMDDFISLQPGRKFAVDMNAGWRDRLRADQFIHYLSSTNCVLIEQPMGKECLAEMRSLKKQGSILFADESCQRLKDIEKIKDGFNGINIKLMKCGGITEALKMIKEARKQDLKILVGSMSESSVGCGAAGQLIPLVDWVDLDGPFLVSNDPFRDGSVEHFK